VDSLLLDGMDKGDHSPFTLLVGVALSNQLEPFMGNLCVFPGTHYEVFKLCNDALAASMTNTHTNQNSTQEGNVFSALCNAKPNLNEPLQLLLRTGDVVLCHQKLAHRGGPNFSPDIRRMVYFRVSHNRHNEFVHHGTLFNNIWLEFDGIDNIA
jgi:hypothetical protein